MTAETEKRGDRELSVIFTSVVCNKSRMKDGLNTFRRCFCCFVFSVLFPNVPVEYHNTSVFSFTRFLHPLLVPFLVDILG